MEKIRCSWAEKDDLFRDYHDNEWGNPLYKDQLIFEFLVLETFQAGLSWRTILSKRENFRIAFDFFDFNKISMYDDVKIETLLQNRNIVRNKLKIYATINNSKSFIKIQNEFGSVSTYLWQFVNNKPIDKYEKISKNSLDADVVAGKLSIDLKKRGFKFVGHTVIYSFMQAIGMINDHSKDCWKRN